MLEARIPSGPIKQQWDTCRFDGKMNRDLLRAVWRRHREPLVIPGIVQEPLHEQVGTEAEES